MFELHPTGDLRLTIHLLPRDEGLTVRLETATGQRVEAHTVLQRIDDVLRSASQPQFHEDVGYGLFRSLLPDELADAYRAEYTRAMKEGARLAVDLHLDPTLIRLARYPWELLHDGTRFLLRSGAVTLTRMLDFPAPVPAYESRGPLEILTAAPQPDGQPPLDPLDAMLLHALADAIHTDKVDVAQLFPATWDALLEWLLGGGPDVLHFEGHGDFTRTGRLFFEDVRGGMDAVTASEIGAVLHSTPLRLVALSASTASGAASNGMTESTLSSIAPTLIAAGVPAVIATQVTLPQADAAQFWRAVYTALLDGENVESAVMAGRYALRRTLGWHAIALYRRAARPPAPDAAPVPLRADTAAPAHTLPGWTVRAGIWLRAASEANLTPETVERVIGLPLRDDAAPSSTPADASDTLTEPLTAEAQSGPLRVQLSAPDCIVHHGDTRVLTLAADGPMLPLWFAVTPRRPGDQPLTFTLMQADRTLATLTHPLHVRRTEDADDDMPETAAALLRVHQPDVPPSAQDADIRSPQEHDSREPAADSARGAGPDRESRDTGAWQASRTRESQQPDAAVLEMLDGVQDALQTGLPPDDQDDPLVHTPVPPTRRRPDDAAPSPVPAEPAAPDEPTRLGEMPPPERLPKQAEVRDRSGASLDALPETESLRALSGSRPRAAAPPDAPSGTSRAVRSKPPRRKTTPQPPDAASVAHNVPPFIDLDADQHTADDAATRLDRRRLLAMLIIVLLIALVVTGITMLLLA